MPWWVWLLACIVAAPILWFLFTAFIGFTVDPRLSGRKLLERKLMQAGISPSRYGEACMRDLTEQAVRIADVQKQFGLEHFNNALVGQLDGIVMLVGMYERGDRSPLMSNNPTVDIIAKYARASRGNT